jgi:methionine biosynthesis protein MetW
MLRVARSAIVAFPNFGHWRVRWSHLVSGRAPRTPLFPYHWHSSPNIHFLTVEDFELLAQEESWRIEKRIFLRGHRTLRRLPNLRAETAVYLFSR